jgi:hypothetical protein
MIKNKLTQKWVEKLQKGETINITDLYEFSKVKLKRSRMRKKFNKYYDRYVSEEVKQTYWAIRFSTPLVGSFKKQLYFKLEDIKPMEGTPKIELIYSDYQYKPNVDTEN